MEKIRWEIPLKTVSEANCSEHWSIKSKRHRMQQFFIRQLFKREARAIQVPCTITLTRLAIRALDDDNLRSAFKWLRDEISECIFPEKRGSYIAKNGKVRAIKGRADDSPLIKWEYAQEKCQITGVRIEIDYIDLTENKELSSL